MANQLSNRTKITVVKNAVAAGSTAITDASAVDMANYEGVLFLVKFGAIVSGAVTSVKAQQSSDNGSSDTFADLEGTSVTVADTDDNKVVPLEIWRPRERYVKPYVSRATQSATVDSIIAIQYGPRLHGTDQHDSTTVVTPEVHTSPAEGTA